MRGTASFPVFWWVRCLALVQCDSRHSFQLLGARPPQLEAPANGNGTKLPKIPCVQCPLGPSRVAKPVPCCLGAIKAQPEGNRGRSASTLGVCSHRLVTANTQRESNVAVSGQRHSSLNAASISAGDTSSISDFPDHRMATAPLGFCIVGLKKALIFPAWCVTVCITVSPIASSSPN